MFQEARLLNQGVVVKGGTALDIFKEHDLFDLHEKGCQNL